MGDCDCADGRAKAQNTAVELYQLAALVLGDEAHAAEVVETAVAQANIDPCTAGEASVNVARLNLVDTAIAHLSHGDPKGFHAPDLQSVPTGCIGNDDLALAGLSASELAQAVRYPGRGVLRDWLSELPLAQRVIFVLRAILGWNNAMIAASITKAAGHAWQPGQVSEIFRQALCSLATSLAHSSAAKA